MPLRLDEADKSRQAAMEVALLEGLQHKYEVFAGENVSRKAREIFNKNREIQVVLIATKHVACKI